MDKTKQYSVRIARSVTEIDRRDWEGLFPPHPENYDFYRTIDQTLSGQFRTYYISIYHRSEICCIAPCFAADYALDTTLDGPAKRMILAVRKLFRRFLVIRVFICGCPASEGVIGIRESSDKEAMLGLLVDAMRILAKKERARIIAFRDFCPEQYGFLSSLGKKGFNKIESFPNTELKLGFRSFGEYFASLSRKSRADFSRKFRKASRKADIKIQVRDELGDLLDDAYKMYMRNIENSDATFEIITKDFLKSIPANMSGAAKFIILLVDGRFAGFHLCLVSKDYMAGEYLGLDYGIAFELHLYFILMKATIEWCIENGIGTFQAGALNYDPKRRFGFRFIPQYIYFRHTNRMMNFLFRFIVIPLKPERFDPVLKARKIRTLSSSRP